MNRELRRQPTDELRLVLEARGMSEDRYEKIAGVLRYVGWLQDLVLRRARRYVVDVFRARRAASVLDACCGAGTLSRYLKNSGIAVTGVDRSRSMLGLARRKVPGAIFIEGDMTNVSLEAPVDGAVIALSLHEMHEEARSAVWDSMRKTTRRGGTLILLDYVSPVRRGPLSKQAERFIWKDENNIGKFDPNHFRNFQDFMSAGGARRWLLNRGESLLQEKYFLFGNLGVFVVAA